MSSAEEKAKTVENVYGLDEHIMEQLASAERKGSYYEKSLKFYREVKYKNVAALSIGQKNWLTELDSRLTQKRMNNAKWGNRNKPQNAAPQGFFSNLLDKLTKFFE